MHKLFDYKSGGFIILYEYLILLTSLYNILVNNKIISNLSNKCVLICLFYLKHNLLYYIISYYKNESNPVSNLKIKVLI